MRPGQWAQGLIELFKDYPDSGYDWMKPYIEKAIREAVAEERDGCAKALDEVNLSAIDRHWAQKAIRERGSR